MALSPGMHPSDIAKSEMFVRIETDKAQTIRSVDRLRLCSLSRRHVDLCSLATDPWISGVVHRPKILGTWCMTERP